MKTKLKDYWIYDEEIQIHKAFVKFVEEDLEPRTRISSEVFWDGLKFLVNKFSKKNKELLIKRTELQNQINAWHLDNPSGVRDPDGYKTFLKNIGYLVDRGCDFKIDTANVDDEISRKPAPQLVVPVDNARFAINAANSRWGSYYHRKLDHSF